VLISTHGGGKVSTSSSSSSSASSSSSTGSPSTGPDTKERLGENEDGNHRSRNRLLGYLRSRLSRGLQGKEEEKKGGEENKKKKKNETDFVDPGGSRIDRSVSWTETISAFNRSIRIEMILGILLLGAVAVLTNTGLPASEFQGVDNRDAQAATNIQNLLITTSGTNGGQGGMSGYSAAQYVDNATVRIKLSVVPLAVGNNDFEIEFLDLSESPIEMQSVTVKMTQYEEGIGPIEIQTTQVSDGFFTANASFGLEGEWELFVEGTRKEANTLNLAATFDVFVKPDLDQIEYTVTQVAMPSNGTQPLYPVYDASRNSIWVGDTALESGRIFEYDIDLNQYREHRINGTNIVTTMVLDQSNDQMWFIDPITKVLGVYNPQENSTQLYNFPNDQIVPSSIAFRDAQQSTTQLSLLSNSDPTDAPSENGTESESRIGSNSPTIWITSPSTNEVLIFDTEIGNFTESLSLPTPNSGPLGISIDSTTGQIWVAEGSAGKIANIDPANNFTVSEFDPLAAQADGGSGQQDNDTLISPTALLIDPYTGVIYISEHDGHVISIFDPIFGTFSDFQPLEEDVLPFGMILDEERNLWVAEHVTNRIAVIDPSTGKYKEVTLPSSSPFVQYLTADNDGRVWFAAQRGNALGYIISSINPMPVSSSSESPGQGRDAAAASVEGDQTGLDISYEYVISPIIAIGLIAIAAVYVNTVMTLNSSIRKVNNSALF
jgi:copper transport protein